MRTRLLRFRWPIAMTILAGLLVAGFSQAAEEEHPIFMLKLRGVLDPSAVHFVTRGMEEARKERACALVLDLDTPGGMDRSVQKIVQAVLDSPVPVVAYVVAGGSAGAAIAESAHVAATAAEIGSLDELLRQAEGRQVKTVFGVTTLSLQGRPRRRVPLSWVEKGFHQLSHPNAAYSLFLLGLYGLVYELAAPGAVFPGILGALFLVLSVVALETLEAGWAGIGLIVLSVMIFIAGVRFARYRILIVAAIPCFALGSALLFPGTRIPQLRLAVSTIGAATLLTAAFFLGIVGAGLRASRRKRS